MLPLSCAMIVHVNIGCSTDGMKPRGINLMAHNSYISVASLVSITFCHFVFQPTPTLVDSMTIPSLSSRFELLFDFSNLFFSMIRSPADVVNRCD